MVFICGPAGLKMKLMKVPRHKNRLLMFIEQPFLISGHFPIDWDQAFWHCVAAQLVPECLHSLVIPLSAAQTLVGGGKAAPEPNWAFSSLSRCTCFVFFRLSCHLCEAHSSRGFVALSKCVSAKFPSCQWFQFLTTVGVFFTKRGGHRQCSSCVSVSSQNIPLSTFWHSVRNTSFWIEVTNTRFSSD